MALMNINIFRIIAFVFLFFCFRKIDKTNKSLKVKIDLKHFIGLLTGSVLFLL